MRMTSRAARALSALVLLSTTLSTSGATPAWAADAIPAAEAAGAASRLAGFDVGPATPVRLNLTRAEALALTGPAPPVTAGLLSPTQEIRLSKGAKTAIIVTAIVVGSLVVLGLFVVAQPGRRL
jgi:hypothetical protein